jgi:hypothetical protein
VTCWSCHQELEVWEQESRIHKLCPELLVILSLINLISEVDLVTPWPRHTLCSCCVCSNDVRFIAPGT